MKKRLRLVIALTLLVLVVAAGGWLLSAYARTRQMVSDTADILIACLMENPELTRAEAESVLVTYALSGSLNLKLIDGAVPGDLFGNPIRIELVSDSTMTMVYVFSPGVDGMPGTFDDIGCSVASDMVYREPSSSPDSTVPVEQPPDSTTSLPALEAPPEDPVSGDL
jgi:hypothetical protein